jgi:hypothetical protein
MDLRALDLRKLNSATKYPSIETFHAIGDKGRLLPEIRNPIPNTWTLEDMSASEKIDGTSARVIVIPGDPVASYFIGSREDLLTYQHDLVHTSSLGIVDAVRKTAESIVADDDNSNAAGIEGDVLVFYGEVYGGTLPAAKSYTTATTRQVGFRLFDMARYNAAMFDKVMGMSVEQIALWRQDGWQPFVYSDALAKYADTFKIPLVPKLKLKSLLPKGIKETYEWLKEMLPGHSAAGLDAAGKPEGLVLRSTDRTWIAKIRYEDYERTLR